MNQNTHSINRAVDYIIVGQGLAGSILAWFLYKENKSFIIIDEHKGETSSKKATGLINPITGRRFVKSWKIDELLPYAEETYLDIEKQFGCKLLSKTKVHRILQTVEQQNDWAAKLEDTRYQNYLRHQSIILHNDELIENKLGCIEIEPVLKVDTPKLIDKLATFFESKNQVLREKFIYDDLQINIDNIHYHNIKAKQIIFCEGYNAINNPYFKNLPFLLSKGEVLLFESKDLCQDFIIGGSTNITPLGNHVFSIGATYAWDDMSLETTEQKRLDLIEKLESIINCGYKIIDQKAGIRPTVKDRRPLLGAHQKHKNVFIFNGMGTKGLSLAPYFAKHFISHLESGTELDNEVSLTRLQ